MELTNTELIATSELPGNLCKKGNLISYAALLVSKGDACQFLEGNAVDLWSVFYRH